MYYLLLAPKRAHNFLKYDFKKRLLSHSLRPNPEVRLGSAWIGLGKHFIA